jgi:hypothetical protein
LKFFFAAIFSLNAYAIETIKYEFSEKLVLKIVRVTPDGFETYSLANHNGREMTLVCAKNRVYEFNSKAFIEYRNFYNEIAGRFIIDSNEVCKEMAQFIEQAHAAVDEERPFIITLNKKSKMVEKIVYPKVDPLADKGRTSDLFLKKEILFNPAPKFQVN